ncbi:MAG TPA: tripartite tricarboxylate transporter substrate-binding protein [Burkholderiales bacterium]|nr:tripartite tricarboxylate transporter substrate-binding protein [Burkholderiales bacterium]HSA70913.1 tripartite tricarboxylate transporter substrate-binding protein [Burkholderiales bacterium]
MHPNPTRRRIVAGAGAALALGAVNVRAQAYPSKNMRVVIPTGQGGGAERLARAFDAFWGPMLKTNFEYSFFPGAAGQVGYEVFVNKREKDGYNLLFGNMGPEMIMYALQKPAYRFPEDYQYFCRTDIDDSVVFALRKSKFQRVEDLVAEAKRRVVNVAVSRLPHPASIGMLALGAAVGAKFNLVPYGGGNPTTVAVLNGEADCGALPIAGVVAQREQMKVLGVFNDENALAKYSDNAPPVNKVFGTKLPDLSSSRSWAIHTEVIEKFPDRFALLEKTSRQVFDNPKYREEYAKTGAPVETIQYGDRALCTRYAKAMVELANEYRSLLTAKEKGKGKG